MEAQQRLLARRIAAKQRVGRIRSASIILLMVLEAQSTEACPPSDSALARLLSLRNLAALALVHCVLFTGLMFFAFVIDHPQPVTFIFGFTHGVLYMVMSVAIIFAARLRTVSVTTAIVVIVLGAAGPYFGAFDLVREERKRRLEATGRGAHRALTGQARCYARTVVTCHLRYEIDPAEIDAFERFARRWMELVDRHGGTHHGYFLPSEGASDIAYALFSFPSLAEYERYRARFGVDEEFIAADRIRDESGCVKRFERTFLRPLLPDNRP